jgi:fatty acid-binding protein DegV
MEERMRKEFPGAEKIYFGQISPALVVHTGPGLLGLGIQILGK